MEAKTAEKAKELKSYFDIYNIALGFSLGLTFGLILLLAYCMLIINAQDATIHGLLLNCSSLPMSPAPRQ